MQQHHNDMDQCRIINNIITLTNNLLGHKSYRSQRQVDEHHDIKNARGSCSPRRNKGKSFRYRRSPSLDRGHGSYSRRGQNLSSRRSDYTRSKDDSRHQENNNGNNNKYISHRSRDYSYQYKPRNKVDRYNNPINYSQSIGRSKRNYRRRPNQAYDSGENNQEATKGYWQHKHRSRSLDRKTDNQKSSRSPSYRETEIHTRKKGLLHDERNKIPSEETPGTGRGRDHELRERNQIPKRRTEITEIITSGDQNPPLPSMQLVDEQPSLHQSIETSSTDSFKELNNVPDSPTRQPIQSVIIQPAEPVSLNVEKQTNESPPREDRANHGNTFGTVLSEEQLIEQFPTIYASQTEAAINFDIDKVQTPDDTTHTTQLTTSTKYFAPQASEIESMVDDMRQNPIQESPPKKAKMLYTYATRRSLFGLSKKM